jgi:type I restriction enzyme R subunit
MPVIPKTQELYSAHIPALQILMAMGYEYLSPEDALQKRGGKITGLLLRDVLIDELKKRRFEYKGESYPLSPNAIDQIVRELDSPTLGEGLLVANERLYDKLTFGITVTEFVDGKKVQPTIQIIDWQNAGSNRFHISDEFEVLNAQGTGHRRPDIVCFINGLPLVIIEAKRPDSNNPHKDMIAEGISQHLRNQGHAEIPQLFAYSQLLLSINGLDGRYATTYTQAKFWSIWRDEEFDEAVFSKIKNRKLTATQKKKLFAHREPWFRDYFEQQSTAEKLPTDQDRLLIGLLKPERLLEFVRFFIIFDKRFGKIAARYPQFFGTRRMLQQVNRKDRNGARQGGVIWHTTGSGKSFSMVFLCKSLILHEKLRNCRVVVVTDRIDLEKQLSKTFIASGAFGSEIATRKEGEHAKARSGKDLAKRIGQGNERIIFSIIDKFATASKQPACFNASADIIVLVDEGHRGHGGETHQRMRNVLPNAAYIAFTGTPLLKGEKTTNKFGPIIHAYSMQRAVEDKAVTPLLYEERVPELELNEKAIDNWFEKITAGLSDRQKADLKKKFAGKGSIYKSANRIELIAWDISTHFNENFKNLNKGLKAQLATDSRVSAIRYHHYLTDIGLLTCAVIMSPPDTREGHTEVDEDESHLPEIQAWWQKHVGKQREEDYTRDMITAFSTDEGPDLLIVVDKLLTGFDEPRNTVLYIDKLLKDHNIIQAVARVNRLHEEKRYGFLIDYRGVLKELDTAIREYQDLAGHTQCGFDIDDLEGLYHQVNTEYKRLPMLHDRLWATFQSVKNKQDLEQYRQILIPHYAEDEEGNSYDTRQKVRDDFFEVLTEFGLCLKIALSSSGFYQDHSFSETDIRTYKLDLAFFTGLRKIARQDAQETVDFSVYEKQISKLVDKHVVGTGVREPKGIYIVNELGKGKPEDWSPEKTRNETDIIRTRIKKTIEQGLADDPYAQKVFSELLKQAIAEAEALFDHPFKQYVLFKDLQEKVNSRDIGDSPATLKDRPHVRAYYGVIRLAMGEEAFRNITGDQQNSLIDLAFEIDKVVDGAVAEHSLNPLNIETSIRKALLPPLYKLLGMDKARDAIDSVVHIMRVGLARKNES